MQRHVLVATFIPCTDETCVCVSCITLKNLFVIKRPNQQQSMSFEPKEKKKILFHHSSLLVYYITQHTLLIFDRKFFSFFPLKADKQQEKGRATTTSMCET